MAGRAEENPARKFTREILRYERNVLAAPFAVMIIYRRAPFAIIRITLREKSLQGIKMAQDKKQGKRTNDGFSLVESFMQKSIAR